VEGVVVVGVVVVGVVVVGVVVVDGVEVDWVDLAARAGWVLHTKVHGESLFDPQVIWPRQSQPVGAFTSQIPPTLLHSLEDPL
jgi:hypothetical protein